MTSYLVTLETDHHWTWLKMRATDEQTAIETSGADVLSSRKKLRKTLGGGGWHRPPPLYVRGLIDLAKAKSEASAYILKVEATKCNIINCQPLTGNVQILATLL